ncbi:MAG: preprotein translocase subunit SecA [Planctomycetota bacterium]|jgi:preprotein translocase subunit SecA
MDSMAGEKWKLLEQPAVEKLLPRGLDAAWDFCMGVCNQHLLKNRSCMSRARNVLALAHHYADQTNEKLRQAAIELRAVFRCQRDQSEDLDRAFALIREVASRQLGERHFHCQIAGAFAIDAGCVAEMATGEGKTLTATMPAVVAGWRGRGCHIITANDYLAERDAQWMKCIYRFCGLDVAFIEQSMTPRDRQKAYLADITYCTNKEVIADHLRDRLIMRDFRSRAGAMLSHMIDSGTSPTNRLVQRGLEFAIVDEADAILIDESVTPLIISGTAPNTEFTEVFQQAASVAEDLCRNTDYEANRRYNEILLTPAGLDKTGRLTENLGGFWRDSRRREEAIIKALTAREFYRKDKHYVLDQGKVVIVDDFTGRLMPDRTWRDGLHQAIEAKEALEITSAKDTYARISFQRFFRMYRRLAGMTGTAREAAAEFWQMYHLPVVVIPTNRPCIREVLPDTMLANKSAKWKSILGQISKINHTGRPILIGTRTVADSEHLSRLLQQEHLEHSVLNAVRHREEAQIVARAGQKGRITIATNMAGRGTDIKLGRDVKSLGGLHVIAAERNEFARIDRQLFGRCARQGDPGTAQAIVSLEDEFVGRYCPHLTAFLKRRNRQATGDISSAAVGVAFQVALRRAQKLALRQRKAVMRTDHWLDEHLGFARKL